MRVYVALPLPEAFKAELRQRLRPLHKKKPQYHWVDDVEDLHITIAFPGELDAQGAHCVQNAVRMSAADFSPIRISAPGLFLCFFYRDSCGPSPVSSRSRCFFGASPKDGSRWGGVDCAALKFKNGEKEMTALADSIDAMLMRIGEATGNTFHEKIKRPFIPYVVVVRRGRPRNPVGMYNDLLLDPPLECVLDKVAVYMSEKRPSGKVWTAQKVFRL